MNFSPIGVFDSGIGGLTVVKEIIKVLPNESIIYLGDTARVPYGTRSKEVVTRFAKELVNFLLKKKVKVLVVACNTISAQSLDALKALSPVSLIDVLGPAVRKAVKSTKNKKIGVIGTQGTINSRAYEKAIQKLDPKIKVASVACPLFVPLVEEGLIDHVATKLIAKEYLDGFKNGTDTLILGCTHYPILQKVIQQIVGEITIIDSAKPTAEALKKILEEKGLLSQSRYPTYEFYVTDAPERVYKVAGRFFGSELVSKIKKVTL